MGSCLSILGLQEQTAAATGVLKEEDEIVLPPPIKGYNVKMTLGKGRNLVAKDRHLITRQKTGSDPYAQVYLGLDQLLGKTEVVEKTVDPEWNFSASFHLKTYKEDKHTKKEEAGFLFVAIYDQDKMTSDDTMGTVVIPIPAVMEAATLQTWYAVDTFVCPNAEGEVDVTLKVNPVFGEPEESKLSKTPTEERRELLSTIVKEIYAARSSKPSPDVAELFEVKVDARLKQDTADLESWLKTANSKFGTDAFGKMLAQ